MKKKNPIYLFSLVCLIFGGSAMAQKHSRFQECPSERKVLVEKLAKRCATDKRKAKAWAKARGLPMRIDNGRQLRQLVAVRNGKPLYLITHNSNAAISAAADRVRNPIPYNLSGAGIKVGVWDGGAVLTTHQEFGGRVMVKDLAHSHFHATHVGGTIGASGVDSDAKGMAPAVTIHSYDWGNDLAEMGASAASAPGQTEALYLSNHSYGYGRGWSDGIFDSYDQFGQYNEVSRDTDEVVEGNQYYLPFFSAGNDRGDEGDAEYKEGYDTIADYAIAKNVITVGAVDDAVSPAGDRYLPGARMAYFSSWGPADDGRIKPDIVANGEWLYSCYDSNNSAYDWMSGTSMASPSACGAAALLAEYYDKLLPGQAMRASTLKGLIIHTADDLGRPGPDYCNGWGLMNTWAAAELLKAHIDLPILLTEASLTAPQPSETYSFLSNGNAPVRVTLCWTDPAGEATNDDDSRTPRLVNDLDLKVVGPDGTFWPYMLSYADPEANATATGKNDIDNVEQVYIATPAAGEYTITINYDGSLTDKTQWYSLLVSGPVSDSDSDGMPDAWETEYFMDPTGAIASADADGDGADNLTEYISGYNPTNPSSVFEITNFSVPPTNGAPFIIEWAPITGRIYTVKRTDNLINKPFATISGELPDSVNSYTDSENRTENSQFYRVDVRLEE